MNGSHLPQFFTKAPEKKRATIEGDELRHLRVLRLKKGDPVRVFDGSGQVWQGTVSKIERRQAIVALDTALPRHERELEITLATAIPKGARHDWLVEKAAELGVTSFIPVTFERSAVRLPATSNKIARWQRIAREATSQSNQPWIMEVIKPMDPQALLNQTKAYDLSIIALPGAKPATTALDGLKQKPSHVLIVIGPEGGFTEHEQRLFTEAGFLPVGMGPAICRTETAGIVLTAWLKYNWSL